MDGCISTRRSLPGLAKLYWVIGVIPAVPVSQDPGGMPPRKRSHYFQICRVCWSVYVAYGIFWKLDMPPEFGSFAASSGDCCGLECGIKGRTIACGNFAVITGNSSEKRLAPDCDYGKM